MSATLAAGACLDSFDAAAAAENEPQLAEDVAADIAKLSSPVRSERSEAERRLAEGDLSILQSLPAPQDVTDPAAQLAIERIRKHLEERQALQDASPTLLDASSIHTLADLKHAAPEVELTAAQASQRVNLREGSRSFWEVVDAAAKQNGLWPVVADVVRFRQRTPADERQTVTHDGAFRLVSDPLRLKPISGESGSQLVRATLQVQCEPKLRPLFVSYAADEIALKTSNGETLPPFNPRARYELPFGDGGRTASLGLDFVAATADPQPPFELRGKFTVTAAAGKEPFVFPLNNDRVETLSRGGVTIRLRKARSNADGTADVELSVVYDTAGPAFESHRTWVYHNLAYLTYWLDGDQSRKTIRLDHQPGFSTLAASNGGVMLAYRFEGIPPEARDISFRYEAPTKIVDVPVKVEQGRLGWDER
jgi:hypothetical protein